MQYSNSLESPMTVTSRHAVGAIKLHKNLTEDRLATDRYPCHRWVGIKNMGPSQELKLFYTLQLGRVDMPLRTAVLKLLGTHQR